jgi:hypothetical protein
MSKGVTQKAGAPQVRASESGVTLLKSSNASVEKINEAVRNAKPGAALKSPNIYLALSADNSERPAVRPSIAGRK